MSPELVVFLEAFDSATTPPLAATLTGLSLTAASLLTNLAKTQTDKLPGLQEDIQKLHLVAENTPIGPAKAASLVLVGESKKTYNNAREVASQATRALRALLWAFAAFTFNLLESLTLDALIENPILHAADQTRQAVLLSGADYLTFLPIDAGISGVSLIVGLGLLADSAFRMSKVIPKV